MTVLPATKNDAEAIHQLTSLRDGSSVKDIFTTLMLKIALDNYDEQPTHIPYIGKMKITKVGEVVDKGKKEAQLKIEIEPSKFLTRLIGQISDNTETDIDQFLIDSVIFELEKKEGE